MSSQGSIPISSSTITTGSSAASHQQPLSTAQQQQQQQQQAGLMLGQHGGPGKQPGKPPGPDLSGGPVGAKPPHMGGGGGGGLVDLPTSVAGLGPDVQAAGAGQQQQQQQQQHQQHQQQPQHPHGGPGPGMGQAAGQAASAAGQQYPLRAFYAMAYRGDVNKLPSEMNVASYKPAFAAIGDDAVFFSLGSSNKILFLGAADGVSGHRQNNHDPSLFSWKLVRELKRRAAHISALSAPAMSRLVAESHMAAISDPGYFPDGYVSSSTLALSGIDLSNRRVYSYNLGDSGTLIFDRYSKLVFQSTTQSHAANFPFQLGVPPQMFDSTDSGCIETSPVLEPFSLILTASDGLMDNIMVSSPELATPVYLLHHTMRSLISRGAFAEAEKSFKTGIENIAFLAHVYAHKHKRKMDDVSIAGAYVF